MEKGEIIRKAPIGLQEALATTIFRTGDSALDRLIETAPEKVLSRSPEVRKEGLLVDCLEESLAEQNQIASVDRLVSKWQRVLSCVDERRARV
jgi:hypothetical protein